MSEFATKGDVAQAVDTFFDRVVNYFPPPVYVGRGQSMIVSIVVSLIVLCIAMGPIKRMKREADTPKDEVMAVGAGIACIIATLMLQRIMAVAMYNMTMYSRNRQHFANTHWVGEYSKAGSNSMF
jgi:hypothetical protein